MNGFKPHDWTTTCLARARPSRLLRLASLLNATAWEGATCRRPGRGHLLELGQSAVHEGAALRRSSLVYRRLYIAASCIGVYIYQPRVSASIYSSLVASASPKPRAGARAEACRQRFFWMAPSTRTFQAVARRRRAWASPDDYTPIHHNLPALGDPWRRSGLSPCGSARTSCVQTCVRTCAQTGSWTCAWTLGQRRVSICD